MPDNLLILQGSMYTDHPSASPHPNYSSSVLLFPQAASSWQRCGRTMTEAHAAQGTCLPQRQRRGLTNACSWGTPAASSALTALDWHPVLRRAQILLLALLALLTPLPSPQLSQHRALPDAVCCGKRDGGGRVRTTPRASEYARHYRITRRCHHVEGRRQPGTPAQTNDQPP